MNGGETSEGLARRGWDSTFREFGEQRRSRIIEALRQFVRDDLGLGVSPGQDAAWKNSVAKLQGEVDEIREIKVGANSYGLILEYQLPMELRRPDCVLLLERSVAVLEFKEAEEASAAAIDQVHAYARDLKNYHAECHQRDVHPVLVSMRRGAKHDERRGVKICGPDELDSLVTALDRNSKDAGGLDRRKFLSARAYCPLPSLVRATRELFRSRKISSLWHSSDSTDNAVAKLLEIVNGAHRAGERRLALLTGVPGSGKTLAGLRLVHDHDLDELRDDPSGVPAIFLSGNGPLVNVLQYEINEAAKETGKKARGEVFIRPIVNYMDRYLGEPELSPKEHVVVYDEAQRAWDEEAVAKRHEKKRKAGGKAVAVGTEPDHLVELADRKGGWAVIVGLIGTGQEIQVGEEGGIPMWAKAVSDSDNDWKVHAPKHLAKHFRNLPEGHQFHAEEDLRLGKSLRSHLSGVLHRYVDLLLESPRENRRMKTQLAEKIEGGGFDFRISRDYAKCGEYLRERYAEAPFARYGKIVSARAKGMHNYGFENGWNALKPMKDRPGEWFSKGRDEHRSCCNLCECATEFEIQGLELDGTWLAWGPDFALRDRQWDNSRMQPYNAENRRRVKDPLAIRLNAYRVLLTRARDVCVVYVPQIEVGGGDWLAETYEYLLGSGMRAL